MILRRLARLAAVAAAVLALQGPAPAADYFAAVDDLPIPGKLAEVAEEGVVFDSPAGRIVTVVARGPMSVEAVRDYYRSALPALGWQPREGDAWVREDRTLSLSCSAGDGGIVTVRIRLVPAAAGE